MIDPLDRDVQRARERRIVLAAFGLGLSLALLLCGVIGLWSVFGAAGRGVVAQAVATGTATRRVVLSETPVDHATDRATETSAQIPTVTPILPATAAPVSPNGAGTGIPAASVTPAATPMPVPSQPLPFPSATNTVLPLSPTVVADLRRTGNGPDLRAASMPSNRFRLDGRLEEWTADGVPLIYPHVNPQNWRGPGDLSGTGWAAWNADFIYLAARVVDDVHVQTQTGWNIYRGDSVELWIDANLAGDFERENGDADDWQFGLSPGDFRRLDPEGVIYLPRRDDRLNRQVRVNAVRMENGYTLEAQIPWSILGVRPHEGLVLGYAIDLSDDDTAGTALQQKQVGSDSNLKFNTPTTFGNLILR